MLKTIWCPLALLFPLLFYRPVYGQVSCQQIFASPSSTKGALYLTAEPPSRGGRYTEPALLAELIRNRRYRMLKYQDPHTRQLTHWFLSVSDRGRLYRVVLRTTPQGDQLFADVPLPNLEKVYFNTVAQASRLEPLVVDVKLPQKGRRPLVIAPSILVKLDLKHQITPDFLVETLRQIPQHTKYRPNRASEFEGRDSFLFFLDVGRRVPLEVVILQENNTYYLLTAFFPEVYR